MNKNIYIRHDEQVKVVGLKKLEDGTFRGSARITRAGIFKYINMDGSIRHELRHPDDVFEEISLDSAKLLPITVKHPKGNEGLIDKNNYTSLIVGTTGDNVAHDEEYITITLAVKGDEGILAIEKDGYEEISMGYLYERVPEKGVYKGEQYDYRQKNIRYNHLALVKKGRAGHEVRINLDEQGLETFKYINNKNLTGGIKDMLKIALDTGLEYEVAPEVKVFVEGLQKKIKEVSTALDSSIFEVKELQTKVSTVEGERDTLKAQLKTANDKADDKEEIQAKVKARINLEKIALDFLSEEEVKKISEMSDIDIKKAVIKSKLPNFSLDEKEESYISASFDTTIAEGCKKSSIGSQRKKVFGGDNKEKNLDSVSAKEKMKLRLINGNKEVKD